MSRRKKLERAFGSTLLPPLFSAGSLDQGVVRFCGTLPLRQGFASERSSIVVAKKLLLGECQQVDGDVSKDRPSFREPGR